MLIGLTGRAGAGKDTCALRLGALWRAGEGDLASLFPRGVTRIAFADALKLSAMASLGITSREYALRLADELKVNGTITVKVGLAEWTVSGREFFQLAGYEGGRLIHGEDVWIDAVLPLSIELSDDTLYVVTDVRFDNEAQRIVDLGGEVFEILGRSEDGVKGHPSEAGVARELIATTIDNSVEDDMEALDTQLVSALRRQHAHI